MNRCGYDRRLAEDRRTAYDINFFENGGVERRKIVERRSSQEKRDGWQRVTQYCSVAVGECSSEQRQVKREGELVTWQIG